MLTTIRFMVYLFVVSCLFCALPADAADDDIWWRTATMEAERDGYKLIGTEAFVELLNKKDGSLVLDVRADYEFAAGHLPGAKNLEFDLGDRLALPDEKRSAFERLAGQDRTRRLVLYCRSFR